MIFEWNIDAFSQITIQGNKRKIIKKDTAVSCTCVSTFIKRNIIIMKSVGFHFCASSFMITLCVYIHTIYETQKSVCACVCVCMYVCVYNKSTMKYVSSNKSMRKWMNLRTSKINDKKRLKLKNHHQYYAHLIPMTLFISNKYLNQKNYRKLSNLSIQYTIKHYQR